MILVLATDFNNLESLLKSNYKKVKKVTLKNLELFIVSINNKRVIFVNPGITKVYVSNSITNILNCYKIKTAITVGNCASLEPSVAPTGSIAITNSVLQYDVDFTPLGDAPAEIPDLNKILFLSNANLITLAKQTSLSCGYNYNEGRIISADKFMASTFYSQQLKNEFSAQFIDAECGSIGEISYMYELQTVGVKGISNYANEQAVQEYNTNKLSANFIAFNVVTQMLNILTQY